MSLSSVLRRDANTSTDLHQYKWNYLILYLLWKHNPSLSWIHLSVTLDNSSSPLIDLSSRLIQFYSICTAPNPNIHYLKALKVKPWKMIEKPNSIHSKQALWRLWRGGLVSSLLYSFDQLIPPRSHTFSLPQQQDKHTWATQNSVHNPSVS